MRKRTSRVVTSIFLIIFMAINLAPIAHAQSPSYDLVFEPTTSQSVRWRPYLFGMPEEFVHIYGNFTISLDNPTNVDYVLFRMGEYNASAEPFQHLGWDDVVLNDTTEPYVWEFCTLDYPEGLYLVNWEATYYKNYSTVAFGSSDLNPAVLVHVGGSSVLYFDHYDRSFENTTYNILSQILLIVIMSVSFVVLYQVIKKVPKKIQRRSHFEKTAIR